MIQPCVLETIVPDSIWALSRPVWFSGVRLRSRTTIVRLGGDGLWVHSPCAPTDDVCAALDALGEVRFIVVPNRFHHLEVPRFKERYPNAVVVGQKSAEARNPDLSVALPTDHPSYVDATPELTTVSLDGVPFLDEQVFFHEPTQSLIAADLLISANERDHFTWRISARLFGRYGKIKTPPDVAWNTQASLELAASIERLAEFPLKRIVVAHADPIVERPTEQLVEAWKFAMPSD